MTPPFIEFLKGDQVGFQLKIGYCLETRHCTEFFRPARITSSGETVFVFDRELLAKVWELLPPEDSIVHQFLCYVNMQTEIAFVVYGRLDRLLDGKEYSVLTAQKFEELIGKDSRPFSWPPRVFLGEVSLKKFARIRQKGLAEISA